jgi:oligopeptide/dipeptide ABC transporter ATP-binding protein
VRDLGVAFRRRNAWIEVLDGVSLSLEKGETVGLVGESGSGKTVTSLAVMGLVGALGGRVTRGSIKLSGKELVDSGEAVWREVRGKRIAMIFQDPTRALNPAFTVGAQIAESARLHLGLSRQAANAKAVELLDRVGIADAGKRSKAYPHSFSGGMCQRVMIALALVGDPEVLIADEPTTALDVTVQARVLDLLREVQQETGVGVLFVTHDLAVIANMCDRVNIFYCGQVVEEAPLETILETPRHPYTAGLLESVPRPGLSKRLISIPGVVPDFEDMPAGCRFHPRCACAVKGRCDTAAVPFSPTGPDAGVRCVRSGELVLAGIGEM